MSMSVELLQPMIGAELKILPEPDQLNAKGKPVPMSSNQWRIESVGYKLVVLKNYQTGHSLTIGETNLRELDGKKLVLRFKLVLKTKNTVIMGF